MPRQVHRSATTNRRIGSGDQTRAASSVTAHATSAVSQLIPLARVMARLAARAMFAAADPAAASPQGMQSPASQGTTDV
jgi:hypothetical protein